MRQRLEVFLFHLVVRVLAFLTRYHLPVMVVTSGLIEEDGRILFVRRRDGRGLNLPGGYLTWREDPVDGTIREVREETGLEGSVGPVIGVYGRNTPGRGAGSIMVVYRMERTGGVLRSSYEGEPVWLTPEEAFGERLAVGTEFILEDYLRQQTR
ncbi:MAG TPA: NUDIX hydrolase [Dehalococcoidia bacterium]|nr:NUDIX hydrolase [Dehalococcoidia bacterium]